MRRGGVVVGIVLAVGIAAAVVLVTRDGAPQIVEGRSDAIQRYGFAAADRALLDDADAQGPREWWHCRASGGCVRLADDGISLTTPSLAEGDRIELRRTDEERSVRARTPAWRGPLTVQRQPELIGEPVVGAEVKPRHAEWAGGWGDELSLAGVRACPTRAGTKCHLVTPSAIQPGNPEAETLGSGYAGWFIGAIEVRSPAGRAFIEIAYPRSQDHPIRGQPAPEPSDFVAVGPLAGPVR